MPESPLGERESGQKRWYSSGLLLLHHGETVYMIDAYPKNEKEDLTDAEKNDFRNLAKAIQREDE
jgi:hypothetical protein